MVNKQISSKSISRIAAIQTVYQFTDVISEEGMESILLKIKMFYKDYDCKSDCGINANNKIKLRLSYNHLDELVKYTYNHLSMIDKVIVSLLKKQWNLSNIPVLLHSLLRVAICEFDYFPQTPRKVIINEYTDIANDMLDENEIGFINSTLHNYSQSR